ncbi:MAG: PQQ-binding-like beta-propeller repeat protein [Saprospiraceae bacterium]
MKTYPFFLLLISLLFSCSKNELAPIDESPNQIIDESTLVFQEGFTDRKLQTNIKAIFPSDKSILLAKTLTDEGELIKFNISTQTISWQATTWYREKAGTGNYNYQHENAILFRQGHHDFAYSIEDGTLLYDEERLDCPSSKLTGLNHHYYTRATVKDDLTQLDKEIIYIGDIRQSDIPEVLVSPPYDSIGNNNSLGRIMGLHAFENEIGEELLAIRYFDYDVDYPSFNDLFAMYNITQSNWVVTNALLDYHDSGTQSIEANGLIYYGSQSYVSCIDTKTGILKWVTEASTLSPYYLLAYAEESIFVKNHDGMVQRREAETGNLIWETHLGHMQRFMILKDKLFAIGRDFTIIDITSGEIIHSFPSPYIDYDPINYFGYTSNIMGFYDDATDVSYVFMNIGENMISYEMEN